MIPGALSDSWTDDLERILDHGMAKGSFPPLEWDRSWPWAHSLLVGLSMGILVGSVGLAEGQRSALQWIGEALECPDLNLPLTEAST
jgi:hypothetical protein